LFQVFTAHPFGVRRYAWFLALIFSRCRRYDRFRTMLSAALAWALAYNEMYWQEIERD
jgi:hypothetical protein